MLKTVAKYLGFVTLWGIVIAAVFWADMLSTKHGKETPILSTEITVSGGGSKPLVDNDAIMQWMAERGIVPNGRMLSDTDISVIERTLLGHSAVASADVYTTYDGCVKVEITQREPIARLRFTGYDMYLTREGYLLPATDCHSVRVPVITGDYTPLFNPAFKGNTAVVVRDTIAALDRHIAELEASKIPHLEELRTKNRELRLVKRQRAKRGIFTSEQEYTLLSEALKLQKSEAIAKHNIAKREIMGRIAAIDGAIGEVRHKQKEIGRIEEDFDALVELLLTIAESDFWSAEVVQLVASGGGSKPLQLAMVPRSGSFLVDLGTMEHLDRKLDNLLRFYHDGLDRIGWDKYKSISLRYDGQVVCR